MREDTPLPQPPSWRWHAGLARVDEANQVSAPLLGALQFLWPNPAPGTWRDGEALYLEALHGSDQSVTLLLERLNDFQSPSLTNKIIDPGLEGCGGDAGRRQLHEPVMHKRAPDLR